LSRAPYSGVLLERGSLLGFLGQGPPKAGVPPIAGTPPMLSWAGSPPMPGRVCWEPLGRPLWRGSPTPEPCSRHLSPLLSSLFSAAALLSGRCFFFPPPKVGFRHLETTLIRPLRGHLFDRGAHARSVRALVMHARSCCDSFTAPPSLRHFVTAGFAAVCGGAGMWLLLAPVCGFVRTFD